MRYVRLRLASPAGRLGPAATDDRGARCETIDHAGLLADGTALVLARFDGPVAEIRSALRAEPRVVSASVTGSADECYALVHFRPADPVRRVLEIPHEHPLVVDYPIEYTAEGALRVTVVGASETLQRAVGAVPSDLSVDVERTGRHRPGDDRAVDRLTARQREVLEAAVDAGYYRTPRNVTYDDIGERLGLSGGTVGEHLRKIESELVRSVAR